MSSAGYEIEIKLPVENSARAEAQVRSLGANLVHERYFEDNYVFDQADGSLRNNRMLLRLRLANGSATLTFKGAPSYSDGLKVREEIESVITQPEAFLQILMKIGFSVTFRYQKYRTVYTTKEGLEISIDETPIGNYLELEGEKGQIHDFAEALGYSRNQYITESYAGLFALWAKEHNPAASFMIFE